MKLLNECVLTYLSTREVKVRLQQAADTMLIKGIYVEQSDSSPSFTAVKKDQIQVKLNILIRPNLSFTQDFLQSLQHRFKFEIADDTKKMVATQATVSPSLPYRVHFILPHLPGSKYNVSIKCHLAERAALDISGSPFCFEQPRRVKSKEL